MEKEEVRKRGSLSLKVLMLYSHWWALVLRQLHEVGVGWEWEALAFKPVELG